jgi:hypothetical protein
MEFGNWVATLELSTDDTGNHFSGRAAAPLAWLCASQEARWGEPDIWTALDGAPSSQPDSSAAHPDRFQFSDFSDR